MEEKEGAKIKRDYTPILKIVFKYALYAEIGYVLGVNNILASTPGFWVIIGCIGGIDILASFIGMEKGKKQTLLAVKANIYLARELREALKVKKEIENFIREVEKAARENEKPEK